MWCGLLGVERSGQSYRRRPLGRDIRKQGNRVAERVAGDISHGLSGNLRGFWSLKGCDCLIMSLLLSQQAFHFQRAGFVSPRRCVRTDKQTRGAMSGRRPKTCD